MDEESEDAVGKVKADGARQHQGPDAFQKPPPQFDQMIEQWRLGVIDVHHARVSPFPGSDRTAI
jgi:hypothetical protein